MKTINLGIYLVLFLGFNSILLQGQSVGEFEKMAFLEGEWKFDAKSLMPDGTYQPQEFYSVVEPIHNGLAHRDNFHIKNQNGNWVVYGSTIRSYDGQSGNWKMLWYNFNLSFITEMTGRYIGGEFHFNGEGSDEKGDYLEKITFYEIEPDRYKWKSDKSYDGGETWMKNFFSYTATRIK